MNHRANLSAFAALKTVLALLCLNVLLSSGCATVGHEFPVDMVGKIELGRTTQTQITELFGEPWRTGIEDGLKTWTYARYRYSLFGGTATTDLIVRFNAQGIVESYSFSTTEPERDE